VVVFLDVGEEALASGMPPADPDAALNLHGNHQIRPGEVEAPFSGGVESVLGNRLRQAEAAEDLGEGHAWGGAVKAVLPLGSSLMTTLGIQNLPSIHHVRHKSVLVFGSPMVGRHGCPIKHATKRLP